MPSRQLTKDVGKERRKATRIAPLQTQICDCAIEDPKPRTAYCMTRSNPSTWSCVSSPLAALPPHDSVPDQ
eukprot:5037494-Amphidinium_carterae.2